MDGLTDEARAALREERRELVNDVAIPDKVFMTAAWNPMRHRARFAREFARIDEIRTLLCEQYWQLTKDQATAPWLGMPESTHRRKVKEAIAQGLPVPAEVIASHEGLAEEIG